MNGSRLAVSRPGSSRVRRLVFVVALMALNGCEREPVVQPAGVGWSKLPAAEFPPSPLGVHLDGRRIGLDPGHGGDKDPKKKFEAEVNLAVALELRDLLQQHGADVFLTREKDVAVPLRERAPAMEKLGAEIFVSLHHNAGGEKANYTSTWYHLDPDGEPANLDLARALQRRVMEALRTPTTVPTPILSDKLIYEESGFAVLRTASVPAVLCEASFYTNPDEAARLRDPIYQKREAYGYYLGLVDYFMGGTPSLKFRSFETRRDRSPGGGAVHRVILHLDDGLRSRAGWGGDVYRILPSTIRCSVGNRILPFDYDRETSLLTLDLQPTDVRLDLAIRFQNLYKHSNFPSRFRWSGDDEGQKMLTRVERKKSR